jgi:mRNA-degrading endonuclease RelE of RelBE toxin-antitoxin system
MKYQLKRLPRVSRQLRELPGRIGQEVNRAIIDLQSDPYPPDAEELRDQYSGIWKIKIDGWRIFYRVNNVDQVVTIIAVKRRDRNTYTYLYSLFL